MSIGFCMSPSIPPYRLKIERAKRHIVELTTEFQYFVDSQSYEIVTEDDGISGQRLYKFKRKRCIPAEWSTIIGDVIHNARAALDILMVEVVRFCDPSRNCYNHVYFVIGKSKQKFEADLTKKTKGASADAQRILARLKPYKGGNEEFYRIHQLDITDKHKAIIPVGSAHRNLIFDAAEMIRKNFPEKFGSLPPTMIALRPTNRQFPLEDGMVLFTSGIDGPFENNVQFTIEIAFGEGQILDGEPVLPALEQMCQFVEGVFNVFETELPGFGK